MASATQATFSFGAFPILRTERLDLLELEPRFVDDIFAVRSDPEVQLYNSVPHQTRDDTFRFIAEQREKYVHESQVIWTLALRAPTRVVGSVSVFDWDRYHRRAQIGYELARDQWGRGLAQEALHEVLRFAFDKMMLNRIEIWTAAENQRSVRLAQRLGFKRDGTLQKRILEDDGQFHDCAVFGLLRADWSSAG